MGGCRCSYRTCSSKSDGKIHMFHFPVFDKIRCHQWITNAQKPNFLDLKLSQLRNRVVCQYHFTDDNFMNFKKDKLKFNAVPTQDGPCCQPPAHKIEVEEPITINADEIENDGKIMPIAKKAHFSVKYGDFLTNEISEVFSDTPTGYQPKTTDQNCNIDFDLNKKFKYDYKIIKFSNIENNDNVLKNDQRSSQENNNMNSLLNTNEKQIAMPVEFDNLLSKKNKNDTNTLNPQQVQQIVVKEENRPVTRLSQIKPSKRVSIISEKKIVEPVRVKGILKPVSSSFVIEAPKNRESRVSNIAPSNEVIVIDDVPNIEPNQSLMYNENNKLNANSAITNEITPVTVDNTTVNDNIHDKANYTLFDVTNINNPNDFPSDINVIYDPNGQPLDKIECITDPIQMNNEDLLQQLNLQNQAQEVELPVLPEVKEQNNIQEPLKVNKSVASNYVKKLFKSPENTSPNKSLLKCKLPPEKLALIQEKRKFNMKIRDIIDSCLTKLDQNEGDGLKSTEVVESGEKKSKVLTQSENIPSQPSKLSTLDSIEARLQRMEDKLMNKIDQNTQKIIEIKRTLNPTTKRKSAFTQTYVTEDLHKKQLYQEISKYLSADANSLLYEELFINKFTKNKMETPRKRRRRQ